MKFKSKIIISTLTISLLFGFSVFAQTTRTTLGDLTEKLASISLEGKTPLAILQEISPGGEVDVSIPKATITQDGKTETIFVFELPQDTEKSFQDLQNYFTKKENFQVINSQDQGEIKAVELSKGTSTVLLVKKGGILVESRQEDAVVFPEAPAMEEGAGEGAGAAAGQIAGMSLWVWLLIIAAVVIVVVIVVLLVKKFPKKK